MNEQLNPTEVTTDQQPDTGSKEDVIAAASVVVIAVLATIHYVNSDGLLGFIERIF